MLNLGHTHISDAAIDHLVAQKNLRVAVLGKSQVTKKGVARLQKALPNCTIYHESTMRGGSF
jgi:hypothetical protein